MSTNIFGLFVYYIFIYAILVRERVIVDCPAAITDTWELVKASPANTQ